MSKYLIVIEETESGYSAYSPDFPGCVSTGRSREDVERSMRDAIELHLDGLREDGQPIPKPSTSAAYVDVAA
ncbi:MAG TPA: type II toxin-antitoxin system HicB family antitoxin [Gemmatimonadaceae bacterium]|nr:type II toxin-antitoxin system HicB family antitoxin [Gemmatimonadaceae bacterium]